MKRAFLAIVSSLIGVCMFAQTETFVVVGGPVEVPESSCSWGKVARGGKVSSDQYVRSSGRFSLRNKKGISETYNPCDCTLVSELVPLKKISSEKRSNNVISRDRGEFGYIFSPAVLAVRQGREFSFEIISTEKNVKTVEYRIESVPDWLEIQNASGTLSDKIVITGKAKDKVLVGTLSLDDSITVVCGESKCDLPVRLTL